MFNYPNVHRYYTDEDVVQRWVADNIKPIESDLKALCSLLNPDGEIRGDALRELEHKLFGTDTKIIDPRDNFSSKEDIEGNYLELHKLFERLIGEDPLINHRLNESIRYTTDIKIYVLVDIDRYCFIKDIPDNVYNLSGLYQINTSDHQYREDLCSQLRPITKSYVNIPADERQDSLVKSKQGQLTRALSSFSSYGLGNKIIGETGEEYLCKNITSLYFSYTDISEWFDRNKIELPAGFPKSDKSQENKPKSEKYERWQNRVDKEYSKNKRLSHSGVCTRLASELGTTPENLRRRTSSPKNK